MKRICLLLLVLGTMGWMKAQELNCNIQINADQIQGTNTSVFNTLQQSINDFVNNRRWTDMTFANQEKIDCNMTIILSSYSDNIMVGTLQVQSRRPVYNTSYSSPILNFRDEHFTFSYTEFEQLEYQDNVFTTNLTAMLAYYIYLIIGYDMDTYSRLGGTPYFQKAEDIALAAQSASLDESEAAGWKSFSDTKNRYALINNLMDEAFKSYRSFLYDYHRLALDEMVANVANARAKIAEGLPVIREANRARPSAIAIVAFLDAKGDELVNIFSKGSEAEKNTVHEILMDVDPTRNTLYDKLLE